MAAAEAAAKLLRKNFGARLNVNESTQRDIKLELDVQAQATITRVILGDFPDHAILGEEGVAGRKDAETRWVVDPLDGTVNYFYNIPHYAVSIAAQQKIGPDRWETVAGVVLDPELDELFAAAAGQPATLNGLPIHVSDRATLPEAIISIPNTFEFKVLLDRLFQERRNRAAEPDHLRGRHSSRAQGAPARCGGVGCGVRRLRPVRRVPRAWHQAVGYRGRAVGAGTGRGKGDEPTDRRPVLV